MARYTAPSLWLPGFNPEPSEPAALFTETEPSVSKLASSMEESSADESVEPARQRVNWRVVNGASETAPRNLWPRLICADLHNLGGSVTKFETNLAAIKTLRQIDTEDRPATPDERSTLLRYTGWGGLPASFNLEAEDAAWAKRARQLNLKTAVTPHPRGLEAGQARRFDG